jgi:hypothetical protein
MEVEASPSEGKMNICSESLKKRILRRIDGPIKENGMWKSRYNHELHKLYNDTNMVKVIEMIGTTL